jgi:hypothetical protein
LDALDGPNYLYPVVAEKARYLRRASRESPGGKNPTGFATFCAILQVERAKNMREMRSVAARLGHANLDTIELYSKLLEHQPRRTRIRRVHRQLREPGRNPDVEVSQQASLATMHLRAGVGHGNCY